MKYIKFTLFICCFLTGYLGVAQSKVTLNGFVKDASNGEELIGVTVYVDEISNGAVTNPYGFYSLTLPPGTYHINWSYIGFRPIEKVIDLQANSKLNIELSSTVTEMREVIIRGEEEEDKNISSIEMSRNDVPVELARKTPALFGEPDIIKMVQMLPGVVSVGEGTSGYFVRGGSADQNLILIDEAPIYDPSHFFGLFSVFNADVIKDSELYKGGIPARFGGRLSSILDVRTIDGNNKKFAGSGTIGTLASKIMVEGPIAKDKSSFLVSARRSYADLFLKFSSDEDTRDNQVYFYDVNAKVNWKPNNKDRIFLAAYLGRDAFRFGDLFGFNWGNATTTFRWNHLFSEKLFSNTTLVASNFDYALGSEQAAAEFEWTANLQEFSLKEDLGFYINPGNTLNFGVSASYRRFSPGTIEPGSESSIYAKTRLDKMYAYDYAFYAGLEQHLTERLSLQYGVRLSLFQNVGEGVIKQYAKNERGFPDNVNTQVIRGTKYGMGETIKTFFNAEPRFNARYMLADESSLKASYNRMAQYIHLLSNSTLPVPFNTWTPSSPYLEPQLADQVAVGYFRNFSDNMYEFSVESFYKKIQNVTDFADNANLFLNKDAPVEYRQGESEAYGLEFFLRKSKGNLTGFVSYTLSKATRTIPEVNKDQTFLANYDRRHVLNVTTNYILDDRWSVGANFTYSTGRPFTLPTGRYEVDGYGVDLFSGRNSYFLPDFHRLDLSANYEPRKNANRKWKTSWSFSVYNAYNRKNPFTIFTEAEQDDDGNVVDANKKVAKMVYLFPILPSVSYKIGF